MRLAAALLLALRAAHALTPTGPQPVVWSLAGSDSSAGAGVEADLRAFRCLGARGCAVVTALTAQSTTGVEAVLETPAAHVAATIAALEADLPPAAVKTGALRAEPFFPEPFLLDKWRVGFMRRANFLGDRRFLDLVGILLL